MPCVRVLIFQACILLLVGVNIAQKKNVCQHWSDYNDINMQNNSNCFYNEDVDLDVLELLHKYFGYYEMHEVQTKDGYFITIIRIPNKNSKGTIVFRHPASSDSIVWILLGRESPAYYFWEKGYEIWMTNTRGTELSRKNINLTVNDYEYWNFSFHEIAKYDLRASLKYIYRKNRNRKMIVIAHSMGSTECLIFASLYPAEAKKYAKIFMLLGPSSSFKHSQLRLFAQMVPEFQEYTKREKIGHVFERNETITRTIHNVCKHLLVYCISLYKAIGAEKTDSEDNPLAAPLMVLHNPRPLSVKCLLHYGQFLGSDKFQMFDYKEKNMEIYGSIAPPTYPVSKIIVPIFLVYSASDVFAPIKDTEVLYNNLSAEAKVYGKLKVDKMNHVDYLMGKNREEKVFKKLLNLIDRISSDGAS